MGGPAVGTLPPGVPVSGAQSGVMVPHALHLTQVQGNVAARVLVPTLTNTFRHSRRSRKGRTPLSIGFPRGRAAAMMYKACQFFYKLYDANLAANEDCRAKCLEFGTSCGYATTWGKGQWCTVLRNDAPCYSLDAGPGQCGSSGVGAFTYKLEYTSLQKVTANNSANSTASTGSSFVPEGQGCCHNSPGLPIYYKLFDGNAPDCQMKCEQFGSSWVHYHLGSRSVVHSLACGYAMLFT